MPIHSGFHVEICHWTNAADRDALASVREIVFVLEQGVPRELEVDNDDPHSVHVLARAPDGTPIGTGRLTPTGRIGRMAVMADWRGNGVGTMLLRALLDQARARRMSEVVLHAQRDAVAFYLDYGFAVAGGSDIALCLCSRSAIWRFGIRRMALGVIAVALPIRSA